MQASHMSVRKPICCFPGTLAGSRKEGRALQDMILGPPTEGERGERANSFTLMFSSQLN